VASGRNEMNREEAQPRGEGQELAGAAPAPLRGPTRVNLKATAEGGLRQ
jgi:hypothetical protein